MKKILFCAVSLAVISGCANNGLNSIVDGAISGATSAAMQAAGVPGMPAATNTVSTASGGDAGGNYTVRNENVYVTKAERTSRDFGKLASHTTAPNPNGLTRVKLNGCQHLDSGGNMPKCWAYFYPISPEGWLVKDATVARTGSNDKIINSGRYYYKVEGGDDFFATGEINFSKGVTNEVIFAVQ